MAAMNHLSCYGRDRSCSHLVMGLEKSVKISPLLQMKKRQGKFGAAGDGFVLRAARAGSRQRAVVPEELDGLHCDNLRPGKVARIASGFVGEEQQIDQVCRYLRP